MSAPNDQQGGKKETPPLLAASKTDSQRWHSAAELELAPTTKKPFLDIFRDEPPPAEVHHDYTYEMDVNDNRPASAGQRYVERGLANIENALGITGNLQYQFSSDDEKSNLTTDTEFLARISSKPPIDEYLPSGIFSRSSELSVDSGYSTRQPKSLVTSSGMDAPPRSISDVAPVEEIAIVREVHEEFYQAHGTYRPYAKEYIPNIKKTHHIKRHIKRRRRLPTIIAALCGFGLISAGLVGAFLGYQTSKANARSKSDSGMEPSPAPLTAEEVAYMKEVAKIVGPKIYVPNSPHHRAATWLMNEDPLLLDAHDPNIWQRYALALFYFSTTDNGSTSWRSCNTPTESEGSDCMFDKLFRQLDDTLTYKPISASRWLSVESECDWAGVMCDEGRVHAIELPGQNITGTLPPVLADLAYIQTISLDYNAFTGTIPAEYFTARYMMNIDLHGNQLTGTIPNELYALTNLQQVNLGENQLTGTISSLVGQLTSLKGWHVGHNLLEGSIPTEIGNLHFLSFTRWDNNLLTGTLPTTLESLTKLQELWVQSNRLSGEIPSELGSAVDLNDLQLYENEFTGTIPEEIYGLKSLLRLELSDNALGGTISTNIARLRLLTDFRVRHNQLTGTIPLQLGNLKALRIVWLHKNLLDGSMPKSVCSIVRPGLLEFLNADCGPEENPATPCACCTGCCDRDTEICRLIGV